LRQSCRQRSSSGEPPHYAARPTWGAVWDTFCSLMVICSTRVHVQKLLCTVWPDGRYERFHLQNGILKIFLESRSRIFIQNVGTTHQIDVLWIMWHLSKTWTHRTWKQVTEIWFLKMAITMRFAVMRELWGKYYEQGYFEIVEGTQEEHFLWISGTGELMFFYLTSLPLPRYVSSHSNRATRSYSKPYEPDL
jgi:hypothetical protein